jgi:hypothetical protein
MKYIIIPIILFLASCGDQKPGDSSQVQTGRFSASYQGAFECGSQDRENKRAIYVIYDRETGISYLAIQGCGTSQLISESTNGGKGSRNVER